MRNKAKHFHRMIFIVLLAGLAGAPAFAQGARLQIKNLDKLSSKAAEVVDVTLDGSLLKLASKFLSDEDDGDEAEVKQLIANIKGVYVKSFEFDKEGDYSDEDVEAIRAQLRAPAWSRIVGVHSKRDGEIAEVYLMTEGSAQNILGLAIIASEPKELTVVNIVGSIDIDKLTALEGHMGVPKMDLEKGEAPKKPAGGHDEKK